MSLQRQQQLIIDQPLQYFFAKNYSYLMVPKSQRDYAHNDKLCETCKVVFIPEAKNEFLMRVENIQDRFDVQNGNELNVLKMSVEDYVKQLYWEANPGSKLKNQTPFIIATETTLTNNMEYEDGQIRRMNGVQKLKGEGDGTQPLNSLDELDLSDDSPILP